MCSLYLSDIFKITGTRLVPICGDRKFYGVGCEFFFEDTRFKLAILVYYDILSSILGEVDLKNWHFWITGNIIMPISGDSIFCGVACESFFLKLQASNLP